MIAHLAGPVTQSMGLELMTRTEISPIAPPTLGEVLGSPVAYAEAMIAAQTLLPLLTRPSARPSVRPVGARHARRPVRSWMGVRVAVLAAAVRQLPVR